MPQISQIAQIMNDDERDPQTYAVIGAAMEVHRELGAGFLEAVYHEALAIEFSSRNIPFESGKELVVQYKGKSLNQVFKADFVCFDSIIIEIKAVKNLHDAHQSQIIHYLNTLGLKTGLLINFGEPSLNFKRFVR